MQDKIKKAINLIIRVILLIIHITHYIYFILFYFIIKDEQAKINQKKETKISKQ